MRVDITDEMAAAAAESSGEPHIIVIKGEEFTLPGGSLPRGAMIEIARFSKEQASPLQAEQAGSVVALDDAMELVFGAEQYRRVKTLTSTVAEFMVVVNAVTNLYTGAEVGESGGSPGGSRRTGGRPRPISSVTTGSNLDGPTSATGTNGST